MFHFFLYWGLPRGFIPIAGFNYGARIKKGLKSHPNSVLYATGFATLVFLMINVFSNSIGGIFTSEPLVLEKAPAAIRWVFVATPIVGCSINWCGLLPSHRKHSLHYYSPDPSRVLYSLVYILPSFLGINGVWLAFPIAELLAAIVTGVFWFMNSENI